MEITREYIYSLALKHKGNKRSFYADLTKRKDIELLPVKQDCIIYGDNDYPEELYDLSDPPLILFYKGNKEILKESKLSVVGSRLVSAYAKEKTEWICKNLNEKYVIVSGLAKGTDALAMACSRRCIGVIASGLDIHYPKENEKLYQRVIKEGLLLSEYPLGVSPEKYFFPYRNRIIAALGKCMIVPCARESGGTFTSVEQALRLGKEIYTIPYPLNETVGKGCNKLISEGANVILNEADIKQI